MTVSFSSSLPSPAPLAFWSAARILLPFAAGYFLSYLYRTVNAVIGPDLVADTGLDAASLGLLTSAYFLTFAAAQIPLGLLLDRFGPRRIEALLLVIAAAGAVVFALAESLGLLTLGRGLIGLGVSACLMGSFKALRLWFNPARLPFLQGLIMAAGGMGVMASTVPVEFALTLTDWRTVFLILGLLTLIVAATLVTVVPREPDSAIPQESLRQQLGGLGSILTSRTLWTIAPAIMVSQAIYMACQGLWAGIWLRDVAGLDRIASADILLLMAAAMVVGHLLTGTIADRLGEIGVRPIWVMSIGNVLFLIVFLIIASGVTALPWLTWGLFTLVGTTAILSYAIMAQSFPPHMAGRANTAINLLIFVVTFGVQWGMGAVINLWPRNAEGSYPPEAYQAAFGSVGGLFLLALGWLIYRLLSGPRP